jgi:protein subunit release factor A
MVRVKDSIRLRLEKMVDRFEEIGRSLADPAVIGRQREFRDLSVEYSRLNPVAEKFGAFRALERELASARDMQGDSDPGMREMGAEEVARLGPALEAAEDALKMMLIPRDPRDDKNIYLEVRAGTGGDEAAIFAGDLFRMYARYAEMRVDTYRASGAGGQHVNKTDSAVRITHIPSGIVVECQDERSQHKNRSRAMALMKAKLIAAETEKRESEIARDRKLQVGTGDRSERIRTYNFPQARVTDHRINLTLYKLADVMQGKLDELLDALQHEHQAEQLAEEEQRGAA